MPRKATFDTEDVLNKALSLFWEKGFHGTSTRDIQDRLGLHPGSVYAAFGSKTDLYKEAVTAYAALMLEQLDQSMAESAQSGAGVGEGFKLFFRKSLNLEKPTHPSNMCMTSMTIRDFGSTDAMSAYAQGLLNKIGRQFDHYVQQALEAGEFHQPRNMTSSISQHLQIQMLGLRTAASNGMPADALQALIADAVAPFTSKFE